MQKRFPSWEPFQFLPDKLSGGSGNHPFHIPTTGGGSYLYNEIAVFPCSIGAPLPDRMLKVWE